MKVVVIGAAGMLGHALHAVLSRDGYDCIGFIRSSSPPESLRSHSLLFQCGINALDWRALENTLRIQKPDFVLNAAGLIKQLPGADNLRLLIDTNAIFPRRLSLIGDAVGFKVIHFSTDCVFSGDSGLYKETDIPDAEDGYGISKSLGEGLSRSHLVLRTSIIGRGLTPNNSLVDWFLAQTGEVKGYNKAVFSGLPVNEIGKIVAARLTKELAKLSGLYHLAAEPIDKLSLLSLIRTAWLRDDIRLAPCEDIVIDRSLDGQRFNTAAQYRPPPWQTLIKDMRDFYPQPDTRLQQ